MGVYRDKVLPRIQDKVMARQPMAEARARVCAGLRGRVVEVGFGSGLNVPYYPPDVIRVLAVEPSALCMRLAEPRISRSSTPVELAGLDGQSLELPSEEFDAVLSTWTMCTVPDLAAALSEMRRILKPGGALHFIEHGHAPDTKVQRWQRRIEPLNKRIGGGCHLTRRISDDVAQAGFTIDQLDNYYLPGEPKPFGYCYEGHAVKA
jgi:ubiquinone/menaquinone biosynthesis C-methylase UbiE